MSGVKVPKLGSSLDIILREFLTKKASKEVYLNKLLAQIAINTSGSTKEKIDNITTTWNDYVNLAYYLENNKQQKEIDMQEEYALWKKITPKIKIGDKGKLIVEGLPKD